MTKRLICLFAALLVASSPTLATFEGVLKSAIPTTFTLMNQSGSGAGAATLTVYILGRGLTFETLTVQPGQTNELLVTLPKSTTRVIVEVDVPPMSAAGSLAQLTITGNPSASLSSQLAQDGRFVFDVTP